MFTVVIVLLNRPPGSRRLGTHVASLLSTRIDAPVECERARFSLDGIELRNLEVHFGSRGWARVQTLTLQLDWSRIGSRVLSLRQVAARGVELHYALPEETDTHSSEHVDPRSSLLNRIAPHLSPEGFSASLRNIRLFVSHSEGVFSMPIPEASLHWVHPGEHPIELKAMLADNVTYGQLSIKAKTIGDRAHLSLDISGPGLNLEPLRAELSTLLPAGWRVPEVMARLVTLPALGGDFHVDVDRRARVAAIRGEIVLSGLVVDDARLASIPFGPLTLSQDIDASLFASSRRLEIDRWDGLFGDAPYQLEGFLEDGDEGPYVDCRLSARRTPFQAILDAFPADAVPAVAGVKLGGSLDADLTIAGPLSDPSRMNTSFSFDFSRLRLERPSIPLQGPHPLEGFVYVPVHEENVRREFILGRGRPGWVPIDRIPAHLISALISAEDINFFHHQGFDLDGLRSALAANLKAGRAVRGGSTISQQLAKNLFLSPEKTFVRKLQEALLTWELEQLFDKKQILEYYLNIIEWGPGIYGIARAAEHYFRKTPGQLTVKESAYLCTIIPNPVRYYVFFYQGSVSPQWERRVRKLLARMRHFEFISEEAYQNALDEVIYFRGSPRAHVDPSVLRKAEALEPHHRGGSIEGMPLFSRSEERYGGF